MGLVSCGEITAEARRESLSAPSAAESWRSFQAAVKSNDVELVASMVKFPLETGIDEIDGFGGVVSRRRFERDFSSYFPEEAIPTLLNFSPSPGDIRAKKWNVSYNYPDSISEMESTMGYEFVLSDDGKIRLERLFFAG